MKQKMKPRGLPGPVFMALMTVFISLFLILFFIAAIPLIVILLAFAGLLILIAWIAGLFSKKKAIVIKIIKIK